MQQALTVICFVAMLCRMSAFRLIGLHVTRTRLYTTTPDSDTAAERLVKVALTREKGVNGKLQELLLKAPSLQCFELPCIEFVESDLDVLERHCENHDIVVLTSPQAAEVFLKAWRISKNPKLSVVTVGKGTSKPCIEEGLIPIFEPSSATGECLAAELPTSLGKQLLFPCSSLASDELQTALAQRGFKVTRINTYSTIPAGWAPNEFQIASEMDIVTFASPSTVKVWTERVGSHQCAVVIGPTTEMAARKAGFKDIYSPVEGSKGLDSWAALIMNVAASMRK